MIITDLHMTLPEGGKILKYTIYNLHGECIEVYGTAFLMLSVAVSDSKNIKNTVTGNLLDMSAAASNFRLHAKADGDELECYLSNEHLIGAIVRVSFDNDHLVHVHYEININSGINVNQITATGFLTKEVNICATEGKETVDVVYHVL